jgi:hypothetical protein
MGGFESGTFANRTQRGENRARTTPTIAQPVLLLTAKKAKGAAGFPVAPQSLHSLVQALRAPFAKPKTSLAGDPSEVTALGKRHWITSFRWFTETSI